MKHGHYSAEAKAVRCKARLHVKALRRLIAFAEQVIEMAPPTAKGSIGSQRPYEITTKLHSLF